MTAKRLFTFLLLLVSLAAFSQHDSETHSTASDSFNFWFGLLEIPFLIFVIALSFIVSNSLKGGKFGAGMSLIAWGFLVMAIGHIHMQVEHITGYNLFQDLLGETGGRISWFAALITTWGLSGLGFYKIYKASRI
jgi:hypothetical protein